MTEQQEATKLTSVNISIEGDVIITAEALKSHFSSCGEIETIELKSNTEAIVKFENEAAAKKAFRMTGSKLNDAVVNVHLTGLKRKGRILVSNFPMNITEKEIHDIFDKFGKVERIRMFLDSAGNQCAYIQFEGYESVEKAIGMNMELYNNKRLRVNHPNDPFRYHVDKTVIVFNMHERTTEEEIYAVFRQIGKLENVEKVNKTRAYVSFKFREDLKKALWINKVVRGFKWHTSKYYQEANPARKRRIINEEDDGHSKIKRADNELYVANIPGDLTEEEVREKFDQYGKIDSVFITQHASSLVDACYIVFASNEEARKACVMNQQMWMDKRLRVCIVTEEIDVFGEGSAFSLMVKNYVPGTTEEDIYDHFAQAGPVAYVKKLGNGCAVVAFHAEEDAKKAVDLTTMRSLYSSKEFTVTIKYKGKQVYDIDQILHVKFTDPRGAEKGTYYSILRKEIENFFEPCGKVINYFTENRYGPEANNSLVILDSINAAEQANSTLHGKTCKGYKMSVRLVKSKERPDLPSNLKMIIKKPFIIDARLEFIQSDAAVFASNISQCETEESIKDYFKDCGEILHFVFVGPSREKSRSCYIKFGSHEDALKAKEKSCQMRNEMVLFVRLANEKVLNENTAGRVIVVKGLERTTTYEEIYNHFVGMDIEYISIRYQDTLVCFKTKEDAELALFNETYKNTKLSIRIATLKQNQNDKNGDDKEKNTV